MMAAIFSSRSRCNSAYLGEDACGGAPSAVRAYGRLWGCAVHCANAAVSVMMRRLLSLYCASAKDCLRCAVYFNTLTVWV